MLDGIVIESKELAYDKKFSPIATNSYGIDMLFNPFALDRKRPYVVVKVLFSVKDFNE